ncbi:Ldh family oxidoreductase [Naasia aerilata]|uniref:Dehydrogenase n=1 Tax=Naasia aerilata TaxID=1162966 RepID=A0ABN6XTL0_9MICO|nr:Ldh family oxidoreductase [Naasia aerilata]BDZ47478.1 dehydrogenase [Naasia aerilata]
MTRIRTSALESWATRILEEAGLQHSDAAAVSENLAYAEIRGTSSHGFIRLPIYRDRVLAGGINAAHRMSVTHDGGGLVLLDADAAPGAVSGCYAADLAVERARTHGIGCVIVRDASHFGPAAYYGERIADAGALGMVCCNTDKAVCAPGGGRAVLGTNPLSIALPTPRSSRPILDMATSAAAYGKLLVAEQTGDRIPIGWAVDESGKPTDSPKSALLGALLPAAGPKGFGLSFMIDALLAIGGARTSPSVGALYGDPAVRQGLGHLFLAVDDPERLLPSASEALIGSLRDSSLPSHPRVLYPGEPEQRRAAENGDSFEASPELIQDLERTAADAGVPLPPLALGEPGTVGAPEQGPHR